MLLSQLLLNGLLASGALAGVVRRASKPSKIRTVVTTDMESDDLASLVRYILYANDLDNQGLVYTSSKFHWEGDGNGTRFFLPGREYNTSQTSWRPTGTTTIEDHLLRAYAEVYPNLQRHDPDYPTPEALLAVTRIGNVVFEGEMAKDTPGSDLIKDLLLDDDERTLYLQAWGGTNTIARALKSLEETHGSSRNWEILKQEISKKAVILASGFQDDTYQDYIAPNWPALRVEELSAAWDTWGFNCNKGLGNVRGLPDDNEYFLGAWTEAHIQTGPLGSLYRSWLDGQTTIGGGDQLDVFGDPEKAPGGWCKPMEKYDFLSEGDNVALNPLLRTGLEEPENPLLGGWGGRRRQNSTSPDLWVLVDAETARNGSVVENYSTDRWAAAAQNDFAARMKWTLTADYEEGNHAPAVSVKGPNKIQVVAGSSVELQAEASDPDGDQLTVKWWQYREEGTYSGAVQVISDEKNGATVKVPGDAASGQSISIILEVTDDGEFPLTRYDRVIIEVA
ncbi:cellulose-binding protein [Colletotrichum plurivorum]|uniref:Cellulose-binding protein n=1 Tax=Colletotrichum plurivorum TaxID=2175906 RepID=A0A8H6JAZ4_9PEZI|nr:cellulose-binding protein [Colletotrichum plurivorum]